LERVHCIDPFRQRIMAIVAVNRLTRTAFRTIAKFSGCVRITQSADPEKSVIYFDKREKWADPTAFVVASPVASESNRMRAQLWKM
jgi:hypothetical protein